MASRRCPRGTFEVKGKCYPVKNMDLYKLIENGYVVAEWTKDKSDINLKVTARGKKWFKRI